VVRDQGGGRPPPATSVLQWLVQRCTSGLTADELALANTLGDAGYLEHHLNYTAIDDSALATRLAAYGALTAAPWEFWNYTGERGFVGGATRLRFQRDMIRQMA
jgi:hypothetical protein